MVAHGVSSVCGLGVDDRGLGVHRSGLLRDGDLGRPGDVLGGLLAGGGLVGVGHNAVVVGGTGRGHVRGVARTGGPVNGRAVGAVRTVASVPLVAQDAAVGDAGRHRQLCRLVAHGVGGIGGLGVDHRRLGVHHRGLFSDGDLGGPGDVLGGLLTGSGIVGVDHYAVVVHGARLVCGWGVGIAGGIGNLRAAGAVRTVAAVPLIAQGAVVGDTGLHRQGVRLVTYGVSGVRGLGVDDRGLGVHGCGLLGDGDLGHPGDVLGGLLAGGGLVGVCHYAVVVGRARRGHVRGVAGIDGFLNGRAAGAVRAVAAEPLVAQGAAVSHAGLHRQGVRLVAYGVSSVHGLGVDDRRLGVARLGHQEDGVVRGDGGDPGAGHAFVDVGHHAEVMDLARQSGVPGIEDGLGLLLDRHRLFGLAGDIPIPLIGEGAAVGDAGLHGQQVRRPLIPVVHNVAGALGLHGDDGLLGGGAVGVHHPDPGRGRGAPVPLAAQNTGVVVDGDAQVIGGDHLVRRRRVLGPGGVRDDLQAEHLLEFLEAGVLLQPIRVGAEDAQGGAGSLIPGGLTGVPLVGDFAAVAGPGLRRQGDRFLVQLIGGALRLGQEIGVGGVLEHGVVQLHGEQVGPVAQGNGDLADHVVKRRPLAAAAAQLRAVDGNRPLGGVGGDQDAPAGHAGDGVAVGVLGLVIDEIAHPQGKAVKDQGVLAVGGVHRHPAAGLGEGHGGGGLRLAGQLAAVKDHLLGLQQIVLTVQQDGQQRRGGRALEAVVADGHVGLGAAVAGPLLHVQGKLLPGAGQGPVQPEGTAVVGAVVLRQADGLGLGAHPALSPGVGIQDYAAVGDLLQAQGFLHVAAQIIGQDQGHAALVHPVQGPVSRNGDGVAAEAHAGLGGQGHGGRLGVQLIHPQFQLDLPALVGEGGAGGVVEGDGHGAQALGFLQDLQPGDTDVGIIQVDGAAVQGGLPVGGDGVGHVFHRGPHLVIEGDGSALVGQEGGHGAALPGVQGDGHIAQAGQAGVADQELDGDGQAGGQLAIVHIELLHLQAVGIEGGGGGVEHDLLTGHGDAAFLILHGVGVVVLGCLDDRLHLTGAADIGVEVVGDDAAVQLRQFLRRGQAVAAGSVGAEGGCLEDGVIHQARLVAADGLAPHHGQIVQAAVGIVQSCQLEVAAYAHRAAADHGGQGAGEAGRGVARPVHGQQADVAHVVPDGAPGHDEPVVAGAEVGRRHLRILVQIRVPGGVDGCAGRAGAVHHAVTHLILGGVAAAAAVQGVDRHGGAVGQHGGLQAHDGAGGAVVEQLGGAPGLCGTVIAAEHDVILGPEVHWTVVVQDGGVGAAPEDHGAAGTVGGHRRGQVGAGVVGQAGGGPPRSVIDGYHDLRAVEQQGLLRVAHRVAGVLTLQVGAHAHPGRRREAGAAGHHGVAVAVARKVGGAGDLLGGRVAAAAEGAEVGPALIDAGVGVFACIAVVHIDQHLSVVAHVGIGGGVGVGLEGGQAVDIVQAHQAQPVLAAPGAGVGLQVVPALQGGGRRGQIQAAVRRLLGQAGVGASPVALDLVPVVEVLGEPGAAGDQHGLIFQQHQFGHELDARPAGDLQALAIQLPLSLVQQVGAGEEPVLAVQAQLAEDAELQRHDGQVEAHAAEGAGIGVEPQVGQVVVDTGGRGIGPGQGVAAGVLLLAVPGGGLEVQLDGAAHAEGGGDGDGAHHGVDIEGVAHAGSRGEAAAQGEGLPLPGLAVVADLGLIPALQLEVDVQVAEVALGPVVPGGPGGIVGAPGHVGQLAGAGHPQAAALGEKVGVDGHAVGGVVPLVQAQGVIAGPDQGVEHGGVLAGGDDHFEYAAVHRAGEIAQVARQQLDDVVPVHLSEAHVQQAAGVLHLHQHTGDLLRLVHRGHPGQVDDPERHGPLVEQGAVHAQAGLEAPVLSVGDPAGVGDGLLVQGHGIPGHGDGGEGILARAPGLAVGHIAHLVGHLQHIVLRPLHALPPQVHGGGKGGLLEGAVGAHHAGGLAHVDLTGVGLGAGRLGIGHGLLSHKGLPGLALGHLLQEDHVLGGAHPLVQAHAAVHRPEQGVVFVAVNAADLQHVLQPVQGGGLVPGGLAQFKGPELGGVVVDGQLAGLVGGVGLTHAAGVQAFGVGAHLGALAVAAVFVHAAPDGHLGIGQGGAVGLEEGQLHLARRTQDHRIDGIELQPGGVPLAGAQLLLGNGAQVHLSLVLGAEGDVIDDGAGRIQGQHAVLVGLPPHQAAGVQGGLCRRQHLEQEQFVLKGGEIDIGVGQVAGGGMGGGDPAVISIELLLLTVRRHQQDGIGQVFGEGEVIDVLIEPALLVVQVDARLLRIELRHLPLEGIPDGIPVVLLIVDADLRLEQQLLPQRQDGVGVGGKLVGQVLIGDHQAAGRKVVALPVHQMKGVGIVDVQVDGIGGGRLTVVCAALIGDGEHRLINVPQVALLYRLDIEPLGAVGDVYHGVFVEPLTVYLDLFAGHGSDPAVLLDPDQVQSGFLAQGIEVVQPEGHLQLAGAVGRLIQDRIVLRRQDLRLDRLGAHDDPGQGRQADVTALPVRVGHGYPHRVGGRIAVGQVAEPVLDFRAVAVLIGGHQPGPLHVFQLLQGLIVPAEQLDRVLELGIGGHQIGVGAPQHRGGPALPDDDGGGVGGDHQGQGITRRYGIRFGIALLVVAGILRRAVVRVEVELHLAHLLACQHHGAGIVRIGGDGGDVLVGAAPGSADVGRRVAGAVRYGGRQGGAVVFAQREGIVGGVGLRIHRDELRRDLRGDVDLVVGPHGVHPLGIVPGALVGLDVGVIDLSLALQVHGIGRDGEGLAFGGRHVDLDGLLGGAVGPVGVLLIEQHPEGSLPAAAGVVVGVEGTVLPRPVGVQGKDDLAVLIAGREVVDAAPHADALDGGAIHRLAADVHRIAEEVGHAGAGAVAEGDGQAGAVHALHRIPQHQVVAHGIHVQLVGGELRAVDGDDRAVGHPHQLAEAQGHRDPLAGVVGPLRRGDAVQHRLGAVVEQLHHAVLHGAGAAVGIGGSVAVGKRVLKEQAVGDGVGCGAPALEPECRRAVVFHLLRQGHLLPFQDHLPIYKPVGIVLAGVGAVQRQIPVVLTDVRRKVEIGYGGKFDAGVGGLDQFTGDLEFHRIDLVDGHRIPRGVLEAALHQLAQGIYLADPGAVPVQKGESHL